MSNQALCGRALAASPPFAGQGRGAGVVAGNPNEPERNGRAEGLAFWRHARTNPSARRHPNEPERVAALPRTNPRCARSKRTRAVRYQTNPSVMKSKRFILPFWSVAARWIGGMCHEH
jgi:hypothetical protein